MAKSFAKSYSKRSQFMHGPFGHCQYAILYAIHAPTLGLMKIGRTLDVDKRFRSLTCSSPAPLMLVGHMWLPDDAEAEAHRYMALDRSHGEWFYATKKVQDFAKMLKDRSVFDLSATLELDRMLREPKPVDLSAFIPTPSSRQ